MVRFILIALFTIAIPSTGAASITAAWKVPAGTAERLFGDLPPPMEKPPGESKFFEPGDKLIDLSAEVNLRLRISDEKDQTGLPKAQGAEAEWQGDWIVWNARSGKVIARGSWNDIELAKHFIGGGDLNPKVLRMKFELSDRAGPRTFALLSRSGERSEGEFEGFKAATDAVVGENGLMDVRLEVSWDSGAVDSRWEVSTGVAMADGQRLRLARQGQGEDAWELAVTGVCETADGTLWKEAIAVEIEGGPDPMPEKPRGGAPIRAKLDEKSWIGIFQMPPGELAKFFPDQVEKFTMMAAPEEASAWVRGSLLNILPGLKDFGIDLGKGGSFAGLERMTYRLFVVGGEAELEQVDQLFATLGPDDPEPPMWVETNPESGGWGIACQSGVEASIKRSPEVEKDERFFEVEPTRGGDGVYIDLRYAVSIITAGNKMAGQVVSSTTLIKGRPQVIGSASGTDGKEVKVVVTAADG